MTNKNLYVVYEVIGFKGLQKAGPYSSEEIRAQIDDISGYEGVINVRTCTEEELNRKDEA